MKKIEKLTPEQEALIPICRDYWIKEGLKTGETNWEKGEENIKLAYKKAGEEIPKTIIRVNSPIVGALAASISDRILSNLDLIKKLSKNSQNSIILNKNSGAVNVAVNVAVRGAVNDAVDVAVNDAVRGAVNDAVDVAVNDAVRGAVNDAVSGAVNDAVDVAVNDAVRGAVNDAVSGAVDVAVNDAVNDAVYRIITAKKLNWHNWLGGQFWVGGWYWGNAYVSFFIDYCKLQVNQDTKERFEIYKNINQSVNYIWCNKNFIIICARPQMINRNPQGQLHSITQKSIEYPDGWGIYSFNGITIKEELFNQLISKSYTFDDWTKEQNEEIKSLVLAFYEEKFGGEFVFRFLSQHLTEIDTYVDKKDEKYLKNTINSMNIGVYTLFKGNVNNTDIAYVRCYCPSTDRMFFLGVHPDMTNAKDAIASLCQIPAKLKGNLLSISRQGEIFSFNFDKIGTKMLKNQELTKKDYQNVVSLTGNEYFSKLKFEY